MTDLIRQSLGWTAGSWPPDFYTLLGFHSSSIQCEQVESAVLERMEKLRAYQLAHPESVTEAMNLLARALITLSDPAAKVEYDRKFEEKKRTEDGGQRTEEKSQKSEIRGQSREDGGRKTEDKSQQPAVRGEESVFWGQESGVRSQESEVRAPIPLPFREGLGEGQSEPLQPPVAQAGEYWPITPWKPSDKDALPPPLPARAATEIERSHSGDWLPERQRRRPRRSSRFRHRQGPGRERIRQVVELRKLLRAWDDAGDWLAMPDLAFATRFEAVTLIIALRTIVRLAPGVIEMNGPGSAVVSLAESQPSTTALMEIAEVRRQVLAKDWRAGRAEIFEIYLQAREKLRRGQPRRVAEWKRHAPTALLTVLASSTLVAIVWRTVRGW